MQRIGSVLRMAVVAPAILASSLWLGCSDDSATSSGGSVEEFGLLAYVPADSAYVMASGKPFPDAYFERAEKLSEQMGDYVETEIQRSLDGAELDAENRAAIEQFSGYFDRMMRLSQDIANEFVVYGNDLEPVLRWKPEDPSDLTALLGELVADPEVAIETGEENGARFWKLPFGEGVAMLTLEGQVFSASLSVSPDADARLRKHLMGGPKGNPTAVIAKLDQMRKTHGFGPEAAGFVDTAAIIAGSQELAALSPECRTAIQSYATAIPGIAFGYQDVKANSLTFRGIIELDQTSAANLAQWASPMPAVSDSDGLLTLGFSMDLQKALLGMMNWEKSLSATSATCGVPMEGNSLSTSSAGVLLALGMAGTPRGIRLSVDGVSADSPVLTDRVAFTTIVSAEDPKAAVAMAAQRVPLDSLLQSDGQPIELQIPGMIPPGVWAVLTNNALGISTGSNAKDRLMKTINGPAAPGGTFIAFEADFDQIASIVVPQLQEGGSLRQLVLSQMAQNPAAATMDPQQQAAELDQAVSMLELYRQMLGRISISFQATDKGLEVREDVSLK